MRKIIVASCILAVCALASALGYAMKQEAASLRGQIYVERHGMLLSGAEVVILASGKVMQSTRADQSGVYNFTGLPPGRYKVGISLQGFRRKEVDVELKSGESRLLNIGLEVGLLTDIPPPPILSGIVTQQDGKPLKDAVVTVVSALDQQVIGRAVTDEGGRYRVSVEGNQFTVIAAKPGFVASAKAVFLSEPLAYRKGRAIDFKLEDIK